MHVYRGLIMLRHGGCVHHSGQCAGWVGMVFIMLVMRIIVGMCVWYKHSCHIYIIDVNTFHEEASFGEIEVVQL